jgi:hypothetical protein
VQWTVEQNKVLDGPSPPCAIPSCFSDETRAEFASNTARSIFRLGQIAGRPKCEKGGDDATCGLL